MVEQREKEGGAENVHCKDLALFQTWAPGRDGQQLPELKPTPREPAVPTEAASVEN